MHFNGKIISYLSKCFNSKKIALTDQRKCFESGPQDLGQSGDEKRTNF